MGLTCQQLTCRRGRNTLFAGVSFSLQAGEALWVQGRNGSGKTTLLRSLCGLALPDRDDFWVAVEGEVAWPKIYRPRITSRCEQVGSKPQPVAAGDEDLERLRKAGVKGI